MVKSLKGLTVLNRTRHDELDLASQYKFKKPFSIQLENGFYIKNLNQPIQFPIFDFENLLKLNNFTVKQLYYDLQQHSKY